MWGGKKHNAHRIRLSVVCVGFALFIMASIQPNAVVESWSPPSILSRQLTFFDHQRLAKSCTPSSRESACDTTTTSTTLFAGTMFDILDDDDDDEDDDSKENDDEEEQYMEIESLSANQILELIELSFFQACFALSKGDVQPLGLFVVAVKTASKKYEGASALAISECVDALPPSVRPLETQERKLRETWIRAIYLLLGRVMEDFSGGPPDDGDDDDEVTNTYGPILTDLVGLHQTGMGLNANQFVAARKDLLFPKTNPFVLEDEKEEVDSVQLAVVTQTINVLFTTLEVLEEERSSDNDDPTAAETEQEEIQAPKPSKKNKGTKPSSSSSSSGRGFG
jgi:hypothetical protein